MKQRTISAIVLLAIMVGCLFINSKLFGLLMLLFSIIGFNEFFEIRYVEKRKNFNLIKLIGILCLVLIAMNGTFYSVDLRVVILVPLLLLS